MNYAALATAVLALHTLFVAFVVLTVPCIFIGRWLDWRWVRVLWLRVLHLAAICFVAMQAWLGAVCPLTILEQHLRERGQQASYSGSFIEHWLQALLYWQFPAWVFTLAYSLFALLVAAAWYLVPPVKKSRMRSQ